MSLRAAIKSLRKAGEGRACAQAGAARAGQSARAHNKNAGFTLTEALATVIIVGLVTTILANGIALATRQYTQSMTNSEAQMLYSSLQKILDTELRYTQTVKLDSTTGQVIGFESKHYKAKEADAGGASSSLTATSFLCTVVNSGDTATVRVPSKPGQLAMSSSLGSEAVYNPLLGSGSYNYDLAAKVSSITYNTSDKYFTISLAITKGTADDAETVFGDTFTVKALNDPQPSS